MTKDSVNIHQILKNQDASSKPVALPEQPVHEKITGTTSLHKYMRTDIDPSVYGVQSVSSNFESFNEEILEWMRKFSRKNQLNGGAAITKSMLIEMILDVIYYDFDLRPTGFKDPKDVRDFIRSKMK